MTRAGVPPLSMLRAHLNGSHGSFCSGEANESTRLSRAASTTHDENLFYVAVLRKYLANPRGGLIV